MSSRKTDGVHLWLVLMKAHHALHQHAMRSIEGTGLCFSDFVFLEKLLHKGPLPVNTLGGSVSLSSGSATAAIDRLEKKGLVRRAADPNDRRARIVHLTEAGRELITTSFRKHQADMTAATAALTAPEKSALIDLLKKVGKSAASAFSGAPVQKGKNDVEKTV
ncbi:MAG: MarR family transcriptional regulator [Acidobacteriaceae bacterium]|nr:MarR family transcriptional regulator [Acidobacteriaceae bacterium]